MSATDTRAADTAEGPGAHDVVVLAPVRTEPERELVREWAAEHHPDAPVCVTAADLERILDAQADTDPLIVPVRVTWLPPTRAAEWADGTGTPAEKPKLADLVALFNPRRPPALVQRRLAHKPDRVRVVEGESARLSELRSRRDTEADEEPLARFVHRAGVLATERAERQVIGDHYTLPRLVVQQITASKRFRDKVRTLASDEGRSFDDVLAESEQRLSELATVQSPVAIDAFRKVLAPMHVPAWDVQVDEETVEPLHEINKRAPLVFLPTHRSYADPLVLAEVLRDHDLPRNTMLGGNNMAFWPLGTLGKRAGVVFIRRTSGDDQVYRFALREYISHLVAKRFNLEWYVEGGRSRTGKLRPPRMGLLSYLTGAIDEGRTDDVMLVPVSLVYDRMYEVDAMAAEQGGSGKSAEGLGWLAKYVRGQIRNQGNARVRFGEPFSLKETLRDAGEGTARLEKVAFVISDAINRATPATATALLTVALLGTRGRALTFDQIRAVVEPLLDYLDRSGRPGPSEELRSPDGLRNALDRLVTGGVAERYDGGHEPVWSITQGRHRVAAFYRNGAIHHFVTRAIVELALLAVSLSDDESVDPVGTAWAEALRLRDLLKFEFFFPPKEQFGADVMAELETIDPNWRDRTRSVEAAEELLSTSPFLVGPRTLRSFVDAQRVVASELAEHDPRAEVDKKAFLEACLGVARQMLLQGRIARPDAISTELFASAFDLAENRKLIETTDDPDALARDRAAFRDEIVDVCDRLDELARLEDRLIEETLT